MKPLVLVVVVGCGPSAAVLHSGSYVVEQDLDLQGVNLTLEHDLVLFVTPDAVVERTLSPVEEDDWNRGCRNRYPEGIPEQTVAVDPEPVVLASGPVVFDRISGFCGEDGAIRVHAVEPGREWVMRPF